MSYPFDIDVSPETAELLEIAKTQLRETPEIREAGFKELRELLKQNTDLNYRDDDEFLTVVLRCCHWYPEGAIKLVSLPLLSTKSSSLFVIFVDTLSANKPTNPGTNLWIIGDFS